MEEEALLPAAVVRTFVVSEMRCSCCGTDESTYSLFVRNKTTELITEVFVCVVCDLGEEA